MFSLPLRRWTKKKESERVRPGLLHDTFGYFNICHFDTRNNFSRSDRGSRRAEVFVEMLTGFPPSLSSRPFFAHSFLLLARFLRSSALTESLVQAWHNQVLLYSKTTQTLLLRGFSLYKLKKGV